MSKVKHSSKHLMILSMLYVLIAVLLLTVVTYAWFTLTNVNNANLIAQVSGVEAEYEFYVYNDSTHSGSSNLTLINNTTTDENEEGKYLYIANPTSATLIPNYVAPGERFSFALKITNSGTTPGSLYLSFGNVVSFNYDLDVNKIQTAFEYQLTKVSYIDNGVESIDQKDLISNLYYENNHFDSLDGTEYVLTSNVPIYYDSNNVLVIYFDLYFDPEIYGEDSNGTPYTNSNIFMNQRLTINTINMVIS